MMSFISILETLIIGPLKILFEYIFQLSMSVVNDPGLAIVTLSLVINILVLPLYKRADDMQEEARNIEAKLHDGVAHIKKTFSGDERMMILQTYYRQNNYKPTDALKGSVSLLLQIPFFMAAYNFLSNLAVLQGTSFGPIKDLSAPDGLIVIGSFAINLFPILMTLVNIVSSAIYLKGFPAKTKVQIYGMALFFLVFLYKSPSGLVFYWTLNNVFSLGKTIYYKLKTPQKIVKKIISIFENRRKDKEIQPNKKLFLSGSVFLTVLVGVLISSTFIAASPQEFVDVTYFHNPLWFILSTLCLAIGTFLIWLRVFYWLATPNIKVLFDRGIWVLSGIMVINYMFFGTKLGNLSPNLVYENNIEFSFVEQITNILVLAFVSLILYFIAKKKSKIATSVLFIAVVAIGVMSVINVVTIKNSVDNISCEETSMPCFELDKKGKNVVVIMLDRAIGQYVPYIFNEKPELKNTFDGFTYYSNTISFGQCTNFAVPALLGGYEYTPVELNKRNTESLVSKHNEALKVMPLLFSQNGYNVTVCDPVYANYSWIPDLSIYDDCPGVNAYMTKGKFNDYEQKQYSINANYRNFFCFSLMKCMPLVLQRTIYNSGNYRITHQLNEKSYINQTTEGLSVGKGYKNGFVESYNTLCNFSTMSVITNKNQDNFLFIANDTTHEPVLLQEPDYVPAYEVDNTIFDENNSGRFTVDGKELIMTEAKHMAHYQVNMASLIQVGNWLEYLKANGVYDNTKIIIASDHGYPLFQSEELAFDDVNYSNYTAQGFFPLLMVKDFNSEGFKTSDEFMTNADVPVLATQGVIDNPTNPFSGKPISSAEKYAHDQFIIASSDWSTAKNNGNTFKPAGWVSVSDNLWDKDDWEFYDEATVLDKHSFSTTE